MFELILFIAICVCAVVMLICRFGFPNLSKRNPEPWYLDYARSFFPVLLIVFLLRGFVAEPFRIPSGSMLPTLEIGDFILVNKFSYGVRLPILHKKVVEVSAPKRGDIVVFRWPVDNKTSFIKRLIGLPGDKIEYKRRTLYVNGARVGSVGLGDYIPFGDSTALNQYAQTIPTGPIGDSDTAMVEYSTLQRKGSRGRGKEGTWVVPAGHYFMMGDNRDDSHDSRGWGFVPDHNIVGRAFFVWFHYNAQPGGGLDFSRVGTNIEAFKVSP
ncbi:MAG: signal peptidase I [Cryomorphaceae bacterium]|jgi:signal peptidase I